MCQLVAIARRTQVWPKVVQHIAVPPPALGLTEQGMRFFAKPGTFMNQLQWSTHHWFFLTSFLILGVLETFTGSHQAIYQNFAYMIHNFTGVAFNIALGVVIAVKLILMLGGAFLIASG